MKSIYAGIYVGHYHRVKISGFSWECGYRCAVRRTMFNSGVLEGLNQVTCFVLHKLITYSHPSWLEGHFDYKHKLPSRYTQYSTRE